MTSKPKKFVHKPLTSLQIVGMYFYLKCSLFGGIIGKVVQVTEDTITFETGEDRVRIQTKKWAISTTARMEAEEAASRKGRRR